MAYENVKTSLEINCDAEFSNYFLIIFKMVMNSELRMEFQVEFYIKKVK